MIALRVVEFTAMRKPQPGRVLLRQFSERLRALREDEKGWSVPETIKRVGCSRSWYYKMESGESFTPDMVALLAKAFRLDPIDFFVVPEGSPRHRIYDLLRRASEDTLLRIQLHVLQELEAASQNRPESIPERTALVQTQLELIEKLAGMSEAPATDETGTGQKRKLVAR